MALAASLLHRFPVSPAMFYLPVGFVLGPSVFNLIDISLARHAGLLTQAARIALLISLFTVGLKLRSHLRDAIWRLPLRLGVAGMLVTIALLAAAARYGLGLPLGAAVLLAAILAPTDPVLASDVQIKNVGDHDQIRFGLTGEGGLNDGTTFPFVMLGLALMGVSSASTFLTFDGLLLVLWGVAVAPLCGWLLGWSVGKVVVYLRKRLRLALGMEEFLAIGLICLSYGLAEWMHGIGFLAVFAAGVGMRRIEAAAGGDAPDAVPPPELAKMGDDVESIARSEEKAPAYMTANVLGFNQQIEHFAEFMMVLLLGILISSTGLSWEGAALACVLFFVVRPISVAVALAGADVSTLQRRLIGWFGIRGIGSLYYLLLTWQDLGQHALRQRLSVIVLTVLALSVVIHGISSTPLMEMYYRRLNGKGVAAGAQEGK